LRKVNCSLEGSAEDSVRLGLGSLEHSWWRKYKTTKSAHFVIPWAVGSRNLKRGKHVENSLFLAQTHFWQHTQLWTSNFSATPEKEGLGGQWTQDGMVEREVTGETALRTSIKQELMKT